MPARKKKSVPQRLIRRRPPLTIMREPLTREEVAACMPICASMAPPA